MARIVVHGALFLVVALFLATPAPAAEADPYQRERQLFQQAESALKRGHLRTYRRLLRQLGDYPLVPYLEYERLRRWMRRVSDTQIEDFLNRYDELPVADRLRARWLKRLARQQRWRKFLAEYRPVGGTTLRCHYARALFEVGREAEAMALAGELWRVGHSQPKACDPVFAYWTEKGGRTREAVWARIRLAMNNGRTALARYLARSLPPEDQTWVERWIRMRRAPAEALHHREYQVDQPLAREIVRYGVKRLARRDAHAAYDFWQTVRERHLQADGIDVVNDVDRYIALRGAYQNHPQALTWLEGVMRPDRRVREWRIRVALRQGQWDTALAWIEALPEAERNEHRWRYWRARILEARAQRLPALAAAARRTYADLAEDRSFYGFLAADRLGRDYPFHSDRLQFAQADLDRLAAQPGMVRARELYRLRRLADARREWNRAIAHLDERGLRMAAVLASRWGWHDRAILTVARSAHYDDLDLRFPLVYREQILAQARQLQIDPAWVYGVMRQESIYMEDARSHAGALGLMQVMPSTGRLTARLLNTRLRSTRELLDADKNIRIGAAYLRRMQDTFGGNAVAATAAYNAGPQRVRQWLAPQPVDADLWVETLPYKETRHYVQRVMAYTVIFDHRLDGRIQRLSRRMPPVVAPEQG